MQRRTFLRTSLGALTASALSRPLAFADPSEPLRAAVIGHTGRGDFGHGLDAIFNDLPGVQLVAVADANAAGLEKATKRLPSAKPYLDYREMLETERPQLVSVAPRHADQHREMALAALRAGAHVYCEKPFTTTLAEADELLAEAAKRTLRIAVAHQMRMQPPVVKLKAAFDSGQFGDLIEMHAWGKQDSRAGGEDLMVLGVHLFDLMRLFAGDFESCSAQVRIDRRTATKADARIPKDNVGPVAGNDIFAQFHFRNGTLATFRSHPALRPGIGAWGIELRGTKGSARINTDIPTKVFVLESTDWKPEGRTLQWKPAFLDEIPAPGGNAFFAANRLVVLDWLDAIRNNREPECSGDKARAAIEPVMAIYHSSLTQNTITFPLKTRTHPLAAD